MGRLAHAIVGRPRWVLTLVLALTVAAVWALTTVAFDNSTERLLVRDSDAWRFLVETRATFGGDETLFVLLRAPDVLAPAAIRRLRAVTDAVAHVPEVERVVSLTSLHWPWADGDDVAVRSLFDDTGVAAPGAPVEAALHHPLVVSNLVSPDHRLASVLALVAPHPEDPKFKGRLVAHVESAVASAAAGGDVEVDIDFILGGAPYAQVALNQLTVRDLRVLGPAALAIMAIVLFATYRTLRGVLLPLVAVLLSLIWTIALAGVLGRSLSIVTSVLPPMILAIGTSYTIRVISEYERQRALVADRKAALVATLGEIGVTVLLCGATTALGFAALLTSRVEVIRDLGLLATCGAGLTTLAALTVVPAALAVLPAGARVRETPDVERRVAAALAWVHRLTVARGGAIVGVAAVITAIGLAGLARLAVDQDPYDWFPRGTVVRHSTELIDADLGGIVPLAVVLESPAGTYDPELYRDADAVARWLRAQPEAGAVVSPSDHLRLIDAAFSPAVNGAGGRLPSTRALTAQYLLLYETGDAETLAPYVNEQRGRVQILVRLRHAAGSRLRAFVERLQRELPNLVRAPRQARVTGTGLLRLETNDEFAKGLFRNLLLASLAMAVLLALVFRSPRSGVVALIPNLLPILVVYGMLGWLGIPLNAATVTTGAAALGNAVDDTVQYLGCFRRRRSAGASRVDARQETLATVGLPMVASDVVLAAGFAAFLCSRFFPVASLGLLGATAMVLSLVANLLVLPVMMGRSPGAPRRP